MRKVGSAGANAVVTHLQGPKAQGRLGLEVAHQIFLGQEIGLTALEQFTQFDRVDERPARGQGADLESGGDVLSFPGSGDSLPFITCEGYGAQSHTIDVKTEGLRDACGSGWITARRHGDTVARQPCGGEVHR